MEPEKIRASAAVSSFDSSVSHKSLLPFTARISSGILSFAPLYAHARCTHFSPLVRRPEVTAAAAGGLGAPRSLPASPPPRCPLRAAPAPQARCGRRGAGAPPNSAPENYSTRRTAGRAAACRVTRPRREWRGASGPPLPAPAGWFRCAPPGLEGLLRPFPAPRPLAPGGPKRPRARDVGGVTRRAARPALPERRGCAPPSQGGPRRGRPTCAACSAAGPAGFTPGTPAWLSGRTWGSWEPSSAR